ncbi:hypothetical protein ACFYRY_38445 [Streptomyces sp. NPDC005263]|uniref:hypothetical protein n=1 Tax=Streptomyces sp. NPDC005263 TaxID=3364711 RepID=UPI003687E5E9
MSDSVPEFAVRAEAEVPAADAPAPTDGPAPTAVPDAPGAPPVPEVRDVPDEPDGQAEPDHDPAAPAPLDVPRTPTGNAEVDAQLARLGDTDHLATDGHLEVYEDVHRGLRDALTALDARPGPPAPAGQYENRS